MKAIEVECPHCESGPGQDCDYWDTLRDTRVTLGHAHGARSRLVAIRSTLARAEHLSLDSEDDRAALELMLVEALS